MNRIVTRLLSLAVASGSAAIIAAPSPAGAAGGTSIRELGTLGGNATFALDINDRGQVTGNSRTGSTTLPLLGFLWDDGQMQSLGTLPGSNAFSRGYALNNRGRVVGESDNDRPRAFSWEDGNIEDLGSLGAGTAMAHGINEAGTVVGASSNGQTTRPFVLRGRGAMVDLGTLHGTSSTSGRAWGINHRGDVVGLSRNEANTTSQATLWRGGTPGTAANLGALVEGGFSSAYAVNDRRWAVGESAATGGNTRATLWRDGRVEELAGIGGRRHSRANDVNNRGQIVGHVTSFVGSPSTEGMAVLWQGDRVVNLNDLLPEGSGWVLRSAEGISSRGQITGYGSFGGQTRSFLLTLG